MSLITCAWYRDTDRYVFLFILCFVADDALCMISQEPFDTTRYELSALLSLAKRIPIYKLQTSDLVLAESLSAARSNDRTELPSEGSWNSIYYPPRASANSTDWAQNISRYERSFNALYLG